MPYRFASSVPTPFCILDTSAPVFTALIPNISTPASLSPFPQKNAPLPAHFLAWLPRPLRPAYGLLLSNLA